MYADLQNRLDRGIGVLAAIAHRHAILVLLGAALLAWLALDYTRTNIAISTDTEAMISDSLAWRAAYTRYKSDFPYFSDRIVVVVDGETMDIAIDAARQLAASLRSEPELFIDVFHLAEDDFFRQHQFLYLELSELEDLADEISKAQPFLALLAQDRTSVGFFDVLSQAITESTAGTEVPLAPALNQVSAALKSFNEGNLWPMSWQDLIGGKLFDDELNRVIFTVGPRLDYTTLLPAEPAIEAIQASIAALGLNQEAGVTVRLTGGAALAYDELRSVVRGAEQAALLAFILVAGCLFIGLRSLSLVIATVSTLFLGLLFTAAFAVLSVGTLNMISVAFAVLYVGLGVDFAIHICLRYRELAGSLSRQAAIEAAVRHVGGSLVLCAVTTAIGFYAFIPTAYRGVAELGLISGTGMFISLICSLTILPAILSLLPKPTTPPRRTDQPSALAKFPVQHARLIRISALGIALLCIILLPHVTFDHNPIHLNNPDAESVQTFNALAAEADGSLYHISVTTDSANIASDYAELLAKLPLVEEVVSITDFVPDQQDDKLAIIEDLRWLLGEELSIEPARDINASDFVLAATTLRQVLNDLITRNTRPDLIESAHTLDSALAVLVPKLTKLDTQDADRFLDQIDHKLLGSFDPRIAYLFDGLQADAFTAEQLPQALRKRWRSESGRYRLEVTPANNLNDNLALERFVAEVRGVVGDAATDTPVIYVEGSAAVLGAFYQAFASALVFISLLLWVLLRNLREVATVLAPLILGGLITGGFSVVFDVPFNFANIIALPLLLGIGVDSALHILHRHKTAPAGDRYLLQTSTARAVFFAALTTVAGFGNLAMSPHAGTASMGVILSVGVVATLFCTLILLPALLGLQEQKTSTT